ncbi:MAG: hypothetical protein WKF34_12040 [Pyrinomonadaceae bacterium]
MKLQLVVFFSLMMVFPSQTLNAQPEPPDLTVEEIRAAKTLAANVSNRYRESKQLKDLVAEFFVSDFRRRLRFCWTSYHCKGFGRDFWKKSEQLAALNPDQNDYFRHYVAMMDVIFLSQMLVDRLGNTAERESGTYWENAQKVLTARLTRILKKDSRNIFRILEESGDQGLEGLKSIRSFRKRIGELEKLAEGLRAVEKETSVAPFIKGSVASFLPKEFRVSDEVNTDRFFDYPVGTKLIQVWPEELTVPFILDLVAQRGHLTIVAIYPAMD